MDLALIDFDGTITTKGVYPEFLRYVVPLRRKLTAGTLLSPLIAAYKCGLVSEPAIRNVLSRASFLGEDLSRVQERGEAFVRDVLPGLIRPIALERIAWHKDRGDRVVVVSASLDAYLIPWCRTLAIDLICTELEISDGGRRLTGRYVRGDCYGAEKVRRIRERLTLADYDIIYAYGDTEDDRPMLDMADRRFFRWEEVREVPPASPETRRCHGGT
jgi:HAD superfamily hydrolase (TIGR01490 family)